MSCKESKMFFHVYICIDFADFMYPMCTIMICSCFETPLKYRAGSLSNTSCSAVKTAA